MSTSPGRGLPLDRSTVLNESARSAWQSEGNDPGRPSVADTGTTAGQDGLAVMLAGLARSLHDETDPHVTLTEVVEAAVALIPGTDEGSISVVTGRRRVQSEAASGDLPRRVDALQEATGQGQCLDAIYDQVTVRVTDMAAETRWPAFAAGAGVAGAGAMLSIQLWVDGDNLGSLNLYAHRAGAFTDESEHVGLLFAAYAALAYDTTRTRAGLDRKVATQNLIGQAQGILIERHHLSAAQAFTLLVRASQDANVKLRELAQQLVTSGSLTPPPVAGAPSPG